MLFFAAHACYTARAHERQFADFFMDPTIEMFPLLKMTLVEAAQSLIVMGLIEFHDEKGRSRGEGELGVVVNFRCEGEEGRGAGSNSSRNGKNMSCSY